MRRFLIDTDTASDDAVALVMALRHPDVAVEAITVVAGNVPLEQAVQNALYTVELCSARTPVHAGCLRPLLGELRTAQDVHGRDGMGDIGLPLTGRAPAEGHAVDAILDAARSFAGELTLVTLGPLTNVATALAREPALAGQLERVVVMGGTAQLPGNVTPVAEYNVCADPEAARVVFESRAPITMVGWDISREHATFAPADARRLRDVGTDLARFCVDIQRVLDAFVQRIGLPGFDLPDPIAMAVALDPGVVTEAGDFFVAVETAGHWSRGQTIVDRLAVTGREPNARVVLAADRERFLELLHAAVS